MKVVINRCWGGFDLSFEAYKLVAERKGWLHAVDDWENDYWIISSNVHSVASDLDRNDPDLIAVVEQLGNKANGDHSELKIVNIPDDVDWYIHDYDGMEKVHEHHREWS